MEIKRLDNNWMKNHKSCNDTLDQNLILRVISNMRSGIDLFNRSTITGEYRRPSQQKTASHKLPELNKHSMTELSTTITSVTELEPSLLTMEALPSYGRMTLMKEENPEINTKKLAVSSLLRKSYKLSRYQWNRQRLGVEMKGVVFRKKKQ